MTRKDPRSLPHRFERDDEIPPDHRGREYCRHCGKHGRVGDETHPDGALPLSPAFSPPRVLPPAPAEALERDRQILGEGTEAA